MAIQLVRRPGVQGVDFGDPIASRAWIREHVVDEITLTGVPHPKVYLLGQDFVETLDVEALARREPDADLGATFQELRRRNNVQRCFLVLGIEGEDPTGARHRWAAVFEEYDVLAGRMWWMAMVEYHTDPTTGLGRVEGEWILPARDTANPAEIPAFLQRFAAPPPGARAAVVLDAPDLWVPDIKFAFGDLPAELEPPTDAKQMCEFAGGIGAVNALLNGELAGTIVVRITGRAWEQWVLDGEMPSPMVEMVRWIANHRLPPADGVAVAQLAVRMQDNPPVPGLQVIGQKDGMIVETWAPIEFPEGPAGPKRIPLIHWRDARPVADADRWIGVESTVQLQEVGAVS